MCLIGEVQAFSRFHCVVEQNSLSKARSKMEEKECNRRIQNEDLYSETERTKRPQARPPKQKIRMLTFKKCEHCFFPFSFFLAARSELFFRSNKNYQKYEFKNSQKSTFHGHSGEADDQSSRFGSQHARGFFVSQEMLHTQVHCDWLKQRSARAQDTKEPILLV